MAKPGCRMGGWVGGDRPRAVSAWIYVSLDFVSGGMRVTEGSKQRRISVTFML